MQHERQLEEAMMHAHHGRQTVAMNLFRKVYSEALSAKNLSMCLRTLNCFSVSAMEHVVHLPTMRRCCAVQLALCQELGQSDTVACVVGYTSIGVYYLLINENTDALRVFDLAESYLTPPHGAQLKRILQGKLQACLECCRQSKDEDAHEAHLQSSLRVFARLQTECHLNRMERASCQRVRGEMFLLCYKPANVGAAGEARRAMYQCIERSFEPTCPICLEEMVLDSVETLVLSCFHTVHRACFTRCVPTIVAGTKLIRSCPLCRQLIGRWL